MFSKAKINLINLDVKLVLLIFLAVFGFNFTDQLVTSQIEMGMRSQDGIDTLVWLWVGLSLVSSFLFPLLIAFLCSYALAGLYLPATTFKNFLKDKFELSLVETLRAWGKSFLWSFLFIIPGLIKFTYYFLTPYVVFFSNRYSCGEVDALEYSTLITKKIWWRLNGWLFVFYAFIPLTTSLFFDEYKSFALHPVTASLFSIAETGFIILFHYFILRLFLGSLKTFEPIPDNTMSDKTLKESYVSVI